MGSLDLLKEAYTRGLTKAVQDKPEDYPWYPGRSVETVVEKMFSAIEKDGIHAVSIHNSQGWKNTCKELGIKQTYKAIRDWVNNDT